MKNTNYSKIDLVSKYSKSQKDLFASKVSSYPNFTELHKSYKIGDIIKLISGYFENIIYTAEIIGFNTDGEIYIAWDCFWMTISEERILKSKNIINSIDENAKKLNYTVFDEMAGQIVLNTDDLEKAKTTAYNYQGYILNNYTNEVIHDSNSQF